MPLYEDACLGLEFPFLTLAALDNFGVEILNAGLIKGHETWYKYHILPALYALVVKICLILT